MLRRLLPAVVLSVLLIAPPGYGQERPADDVAAIRQELAELRRIAEQLIQRIDALERRLDQFEARR